MNYSGKELAALVNIGIVMAAADGHFDDSEKSAIINELKNFGVNGVQAAALLVKSKELQAGEAILTLASMNDEQKKYACGYLAAIMIADCDIDDSEVKLWKLVSTLASFPTMSIGDALAFWGTN